MQGKPVVAVPEQEEVEDWRSALTDALQLNGELEEQLAHLTKQNTRMRR